MEATPFALAYWMEAIIQTKIGMPTAKTAVQGQRDNDEELIRQLDWLHTIKGQFLSTIKGHDHSFSSQDL
ncbi:hypothetical protein AAG906_017112 [Vitis piasezkii]